MPQGEGNEGNEKDIKDKVFDKAADKVLGKETADRIREHNREIENFGKEKEPKPSPSPSGEPKGNKF